MSSSITSNNLEIQLQGRSDRRHEALGHEVIVNINKSLEHLPEMLLEGQLESKTNGIFKSIIIGLVHSINFKCTQYELIEEGLIDEKKKIKKELSNEVSLYKKLNITPLNNEIKSLESDIRSFSCLFRIFPSIFYQNTKNSTLLSLFYNQEQLNKIHTLSRKHKEINNNKLFLMDIENRMVKKQGVWRPREITKESVIKRLKLLSRDDLIPMLDGVDFEKLYVEYNGSLGLSNKLELIVTRKNNYYLVLKQKTLGEGASKIVYKGLDLSKNKPIAVAYLRNELTDGIFNEELTYLQLKGINGVAKTIDCLKSENQCIFIYDLYESDLSEDLKNKKSKIKSIKNEFSMKLIETLSLIVQKGIIPSDLKPRNIYLDAEGNPMIGDLDIQGITSDYCAPEVAINSANHSEKTVVWSLGATLYEIYCNKFLEEYIEENHLGVKGNNGRFCALNELDNEKIEKLIKAKIELENKLFLEIIQRMLQLNPKERPNLSEINEAWKLAILERSIE